jgi:hypothetical protein
MTSTADNSSLRGEPVIHPPPLIAQARRCISIEVPAHHSCLSAVGIANSEELSLQVPEPADPPDASAGVIDARCASFLSSRSYRTTPPRVQNWRRLGALFP